LKHLGEWVSMTQRWYSRKNWTGAGEDPSSETSDKPCHVPPQVRPHNFLWPRPLQGLRTQSSPLPQIYLPKTKHRAVPSSAHMPPMSCPCLHNRVHLLREINEAPFWSGSWPLSRCSLPLRYPSISLYSGQQYACPLFSVYSEPHHIYTGGSPVWNYSKLSQPSAEVLPKRSSHCQAFPPQVGPQEGSGAER
jgi:hypothetical protein